MFNRLLSLAWPGFLKGGPATTLTKHVGALQMVSVAVTWIAAKIEEQHDDIRLRDLVLVFDLLQQRENHASANKVTLANPDSESFKKVLGEIATHYEMEVFKALGFVCHVNPPHKLLQTLLGVFFDVANDQSGLPEGLLQVCTPPQLPSEAAPQHHWCCPCLDGSAYMCHCGKHCASGTSCGGHNPSVPSCTFESSEGAPSVTWLPVRMAGMSCYVEFRLHGDLKKDCSWHVLSGVLTTPATINANTFE
jgi:hypothetical protein